MSPFCADVLAGALSVDFFGEKLNELVKDYGQKAEDHDRQEHPIHLENLTSVYDKIPKPFFGGEKFADNDADQGQSEVDLHGVYDDRKGGGDHKLKKNMPPITAQRADQLDLFFVGTDKSRINAQNRAEYRDGDGGDHNSFDIIAEPYNEHGSQSRFGQAVQQDDVRLRNQKYRSETPHDRGDQYSENNYDREAYQRFINGYPHMAEDQSALGETDKTFDDPRGTAEYERIHKPDACADLPEGNKKHKNQYSCYGNQYFAAFLAADISLVAFGVHFRHFH